MSSFDWRRFVNANGVSSYVYSSYTTWRPESAGQGRCNRFVGLNSKVDLEGKTEIGKATHSTLDDCTASSAECLRIGCGHPETDRSYCVTQHANMRMLVQGHPTSDQSNIQPGKWGVYMRRNKGPFYESSTDHPRVTKGPAPCQRPEICPRHTRPIHPCALARTKCTATPRIRPTGGPGCPLGNCHQPVR